MQYKSGMIHLLSSNVIPFLPTWSVLDSKPESKMPDCPNCEEDELGMICKDYAICYRCKCEIDNR